MVQRIISIICVISLVWSCGSEECNSGSLDIMNMSDLGCQNSEHLMKIRTSNEFELIRDQDSYESLISGPCTPAIDWTSYDMIAGSLRLPNGLIRIEEQAFFNCTENTLNITIIAHLNETTVAPEVFFGFLIPKLDNSETPFVNFVTN